MRIKNIEALRNEERCLTVADLPNGVSFIFLDEEPNLFMTFCDGEKCINLDTGDWYDIQEEIWERRAIKIIDCSILIHDCENENITSTNAQAIVKRIDDLGRVVIPKEIRRSLNIVENDPLAVYVDGDAIIIKKQN